MEWRPFNSPLRASSLFPGGTRRSLSSAASCRNKSFLRAARLNSEGKRRVVDEYMSWNKSWVNWFPNCCIIVSCYRNVITTSSSQSLKWASIVLRGMMSGRIMKIVREDLRMALKMRFCHQVNAIVLQRAWNFCREWRLSWQPGFLVIRARRGQPTFHFTPTAYWSFGFVE